MECYKFANIHENYFGYVLVDRVIPSVWWINWEASDEVDVSKLIKSSAQKFRSVMKRSKSHFNYLEGEDARNSTEMDIDDPDSENGEIVEVSTMVVTSDAAQWIIKHFFEATS